MASITEQWEARAEMVTISGLPLKLRPYDVSAILDSDGNVLNPLLGSIKKHIEGGEKVMPAIQKSFLGNLETLPEIRRELNTILKRVVLEPDLSTFDVDHFTVLEKVEIFTHLLGGEEALAQAGIFPGEQAADLGTASKGK